MKNEELKEPGFFGTPMNRGSFFRYSGAALATTALVMSGCKKDEDDPEPTPSPTPSGDTVDLGSNDIGVLNYAYALEQLEAAFYIKVVDSLPIAGMNAEEEEIMTDLMNHEIAHRDFLKAALGASAIQDLHVDFSSINFTSRASVLATAKAFEDLGVSAYNGAGKLIEDEIYLGIAGKIVSVEARHAAAIRDLLNPNSADFAGNDVVTVEDGLDMKRTPAQVLAIAGTYIVENLDASHLPS